MGARGISDDEPRAPLARVRPVVFWLVGQIVLALGIAVTTGWLIMHLREHALLDAEREQDSLSIIIADHAERVFEAIELVQTAIVERLRHDGIRTPEAFRAFMSSRMCMKIWVAGIPCCRNSILSRSSTRMRT